MNPLIILAIGAGLVAFAAKQLSGQPAKKSKETLTDSKKRAKVESEVTEKSTLPPLDKGESVESAETINTGSDSVDS